MKNALKWIKTKIAKRMLPTFFRLSNPKAKTKIRIGNISIEYFVIKTILPLNAKADIASTVKTATRVKPFAFFIPIQIG